MANTAADIDRTCDPGGEPEPRWSTGSPDAAPFGPTLVLTVTLAFACFLGVLSLVWVVHPPPRPLPGLLAAVGDQNQTTKTALYLSAFAVILPLALVVGPRLSAAIARGPNGRALPTLATVLAGSLAAVLIAVRASGRLPWGDGTGVLLAATAAWGVAVTAVVARALRPRSWPALLRASSSSATLGSLAGILVFGTVLCVARPLSFEPLPLVLGAVVIVAVLVATRRWRLPRLPRRVGSALDVLVCALLLLAIPDVVIFTTGAGVPSLLTETGIIQFHHDVFLGPANQVLRGGTLLVDEPASQYGIGSVYLLAGYFHLAPIGYGTYGLLDGGLTALFYIAGYCVLRVASVSRLLAVAAVGIALVALIYNLHYSVGALPQEGPLRFGLPMAAVLAVVIGARWPRHGHVARVAALGVLAVSSVWALEGFAYTLLTVAAMAATEATLRPDSRRRWLARYAALAVGACSCTHLLFAGATLVRSGHLPDWGQYYAWVRGFLLGGKAGELTYGFPPWSPGVAVGAGYMASAITVVLLLRRSRTFAERERTALIAIAGATAYGIALFSYFDNRSATYLLLYVALPAILVGALWLSLVLRSRLEVTRPQRLAALAFSLLVGCLLVAGAWSAVNERFERSALAYAAPGGKSLRGALDRLWRPPPLDPRATEGQRLLDVYMRGERRSLVVTSPDLGTEILLRSKRANALPLGDPIEESFIGSSRLPSLRTAIAAVRPGERMLMDRVTWNALTELQARPDADSWRKIDALFERRLQAPLQGWVLQRIDDRFDIRPIHVDRAGFIVVNLVPRR